MAAHTRKARGRHRDHRTIVAVVTLGVVITVLAVAGITVRRRSPLWRPACPSSTSPPTSPLPQHLHLRRLPPAAPARGAARRPEPRDRLLGGDRAGRQAGGGGHRRPPLLRARRHRLPLDRPGARHRPVRRALGAGRLDDHPGIHQERLPAAPAADLRQPVAQAARGGARLPARATLVEGQDPDQLPEHHLLRRERLRHRDGSAHVLRHPRARPDPAAGGTAGRHRAEPGQLRPLRRSHSRPGPAAGRARRHDRSGHDLGGGCRGSGARAAAAASAPPAHQPYCPLLRRICDPAAREPVRRGHRLRRRPAGLHDAEPARAARRQRGRLVDPRPARRSDRLDRRHRPAHRRGRGAGRRARLRRPAVRRGRRRPPSAGLGLQALRPGGGDPRRHLAEERLHLGAQVDRPGQRLDLEREHLLGRLRRQDHPGQRHSRIRQHGLRRPLDDGRPREHRHDGRRHGHHEPGRRQPRHRPRRPRDRREPPGDGQRLRDARGRRPAHERHHARRRHAGADLDQARGRRPGSRAAAQHGGAHARPRALAGRPRDLDPAAGDRARHRRRGGHRPAGGRQDRHDHRLRRRLVLRLHARPLGGRLGRLPRRPARDDRARHQGGRRDVSRADLEPIRLGGAGRGAGPRLSRLHDAAGHKGNRVPA